MLPVNASFERDIFLAGEVAVVYWVFLAGVVKLADAPDSKSGGLNARVGSIPSSGTIPPAAIIHGDAMPLLRSALFGLATAILAVVMWIIAKFFVIPIWAPISSPVSSATAGIVLRDGDDLAGLIRSPPFLGSRSASSGASAGFLADLA